MAAGMAAVLALVVGLLMGAGGFMGYARSEGGAANLGIHGDSSSQDPATLQQECPPCEPTCPDRVDTPTYALVYPIEQTLRIEGTLEQDRLREYVIKNRFKMQQCYQRILEKEPSTKGEISLQFTASKTGKVIAAVSRQDTVKNTELKDCVLAEIKNWTFGTDTIKSDIAVVKFDVLFTPIGSNGL